MAAEVQNKVFRSLLVAVKVVVVAEVCTLGE